jgi:hypothetical protein
VVASFSSRPSAEYEPQAALTVIRDEAGEEIFVTDNQHRRCA